ncbi:MAG TPA: glycerol-3-phosphate dehydrogenase/oxidase, partial [Mycobacteriales bacterium]|nr:glycerol-3-phosphate dehydrogenase/oxidase [Mycobacteriales bacterium]
CSYAYLYGDCATDDARLVLAVARTARRFGALVLPHAEAVGLVRDPAGQICGANLLDRLDGGQREIRARHVVNATGVWVDHLLGLADPQHQPIVQPSKGVHVVVDQERLPLGSASVLLPSRQGDRRSMFAIAWGRQTILGTTDTAYDGPLDDIGLSEADLDYLLAAGNAVFGRDLTPADVVGAWAGVRPLLRPDGGAEAMSDISRRHLLRQGAGGLLTITGGKLTTYRRMARDVVDRIVARDGRRAPCRTSRIPLGAVRPLADLEAEVRRAAASIGLAEPIADQLVRSHGADAADLLALVADDPALGRVMSPAADHILAEVTYAARHEGAATLDDVLARRTRVSVRARDAGLPAAADAALLLAGELGRDAAWARAQVEAYAAAVRRERGVLGLPAADALHA